MKRKMLSLGMLAVYAVPWTYFALLGDAKGGTMLLYALMIAMHAALCVLSIITQRVWAAVVGSVLSGVTSLLFVKFGSLVEMNYYFKPFTAVHLTAAVSLLLFVIQAGAAALWVKKTR